jgi:two-component system OmpR family response regulator
MRVLVVEDDTLLSRRLRSALRDRGYAVDLADNGIDGDYLARESLHDAVILDLGLPERSGLELLRGWRSDGIDLPVLILTARDAWHERVDGFQAGADDYLGKPFHEEELLARIAALIRRSHGQSAVRIEVDGIVLNEETMEVAVDGAAPHLLTATEFRLLRYMMLNRDKFLTKNRLYDHIYDEEAEKESNVIEVYINRLRKLVGRDRITTRRGQGYRFNSDRSGTDRSPP